MFASKSRGSSNHRLKFLPSYALDHLEFKNCVCHMSSQTLITCSLWMKISQPDMMVSPFRQFKSAMNSSLQWSAVIALGKRRCYVTAAVSWKLHFKLTKQKLPKSEFIFQPESRWRRVGDKGLKSRREILPKAISVLFPYNLTSTADFFCFSSVGKQIFTYVRMWEFFSTKMFWFSFSARRAPHFRVVLQLAEEAGGAT